MKFALADAVKGGLRPPQTIIYYRKDGTREDLTGATLASTLTNVETGIEQNIAGQLEIKDPASGTFQWEYGAGDVAEAGTFDVRSTATFETGPTPAKTFPARWKVIA